MILQKSKLIKSPGQFVGVRQADDRFKTQDFYGAQPCFLCFLQSLLRDKNLNM